jgi:1,2-phenylacetyl-CoA epoxidase PaaB subunit
MCGCGSEEMLRLAMEEVQREIRREAALKSWVTRRANAHRRTLSERATKAWITRKANAIFGTGDQSSVTRRLNELY